MTDPNRIQPVDTVGTSCRFVPGDRVVGREVAKEDWF